MYEKITWEEFNPLYQEHLLWLEDKEGKRLSIHERDFSHLDLSKLNLSFADLKYNTFRQCDFKSSNLSGADLSNCILYGSDFRLANLYGARLNGNDFYNVDLRNADMRYAEINGSNFRDAKTNNTNIENVRINVFTNGYPLACPEKGSFTAYKRAQGYIIELFIPEDAQRSSAFGRKCRCDKAQVVAINKRDGTPADVTSLHSDYDENFIYTIGETVLVEGFDTNRWNECSKGIHFYITREEALYG